MGSGSPWSRIVSLCGAYHSHWSKILPVLIKREACNVSELDQTKASSMQFKSCLAAISTTAGSRGLFSLQFND